MLADKYYKDKQFVDLEKQIKLAILISIGIAITALEFLVPLNFAIPGVKIGFSNIILLILLYDYNFKSLMTYQIIKVTLVGLMLGTFSVFLFSIVGGFFAIAIMYPLFNPKRKLVSLVFVSILGAIFHNLGQIIVAMFYVQTYQIIIYLPVLLISGIISGVITALIVKKLKEKHGNII